MKPQIKFGLICGIAGLLLNLLLAPVMAVCTPLVSLFAGGIAGYFTAKQADLPVQRMGGLAGAEAGGLAGGIILLGQALGVIIAIALFQGGISGVSSYMPAASDPLWLRIFTLSSAPGVAACFGLGGAILAALAGMVVGYTGTNSGLI